MKFIKLHSLFSTYFAVDVVVGGGGVVVIFILFYFLILFIYF